MKIYIAGKITGDSQYSMKFLAANLMLTLRGFVAINPAALPEGMQKQDYMSICIPMLLTADAIALLPDWEDSTGARIEKSIAEYCGKKVLYVAFDLVRLVDEHPISDESENFAEIDDAQEGK